MVSIKIVILKAVSAPIRLALKPMWLVLNFATKNLWNRYVPFADQLIDRWSRAKHYGFPDGVSVYDSALIIGDVVIGRDTWVGPFTVLDGSGGLEIGENCNISAGVHIYSHDTSDRVVSKKDKPIRHGRVVIGPHTYIGPHSVVAHGVTIGAHVIIGANSFVNSNIPSFSKAWGTPARVVPEIKNGNKQ